MHFRLLDIYFFSTSISRCCIFYFQMSRWGGAIVTGCSHIVIYFLPRGGTHPLLQMNVHKAGHLSCRGQRAILIGFTAQSHYTAQLANIVLRLLLLMRVPLLKNELCHIVNSGLLPRNSPGFTWSWRLRLDISYICWR